jgi:hypothetical protein
MTTKIEPAATDQPLFFYSVALLVAGVFLLASRYYVASEALVVLAFTALCVLAGTSVVFLGVLLLEAGRASFRWMLHARQTISSSGEVGQIHEIKPFVTPAAIREAHKLV